MELDYETEGIDPDRVEELRDSLIHYTDSEVLEVLKLSTIIDPATGKLTDYWLHLLNPNIAKQEAKDYVSEQEDVVLSALAKLLQKRMK